MTLTKSTGQIVDWTALAQNTVSSPYQLDVSDAYETTLVIQAMLDADATEHLRATGRYFLSSRNPGGGGGIEADHRRGYRGR